MPSNPLAALVPPGGNTPPPRSQLQALIPPGSPRRTVKPFQAPPLSHQGTTATPADKDQERLDRLMLKNVNDLTAGELEFLLEEAAETLPPAKTWGDLTRAERAQMLSTKKAAEREAVVSDTRNHTTPRNNKGGNSHTVTPGMTHAGVGVKRTFLGKDGFCEEANVRVSRDTRVANFLTWAALHAKSSEAAGEEFKKGVFHSSLMPYLEIYLHLRPGKYGSARELTLFLRRNIPKVAADYSALETVETTLSRMEKIHKAVHVTLETPEVLSRVVAAMTELKDITDPEGHLSLILNITGTRITSLFYLRFDQIYVCTVQEVESLVILYTYLKTSAGKKSRSKVVFCRYPLEGFTITPEFKAWLEDNREKNPTRRLVQGYSKRVKVNTFRTGLSDALNDAWSKVENRNREIKKLSVKHFRRATDIRLRDCGMSNADVDVLMNHSTDTALSHYGLAQAFIREADGKPLFGVPTWKEDEVPDRFPEPDPEDDIEESTALPSAEEMPSLEEMRTVAFPMEYV